jgi:hemolysin-activating ACP:hemolysin acyltransferase
MGLFGKKDPPPEPPRAAEPRASQARAPEPRDEPRPESRPQTAPAPASSPATQAVTTEPAAAKPEVDQAAIQAAMGDAQRRHAALGQILAVLSNVPQFQNATLGSAIALAAPAIATGQFLVAMAHSAQSGIAAPAGVALWASVSDEVDRRFSEDLDKPFSISPSEWQSGPHVWLIVTAGDPRSLNVMISNAQQSVLSGRQLKMRTTDGEGKPIIRTFTPAAA